MSTKKKSRKREQLYGVDTWDVELQKWTPQIGVPNGPFTRKQMIEKILPLLNDMGYPCDESDLDPEDDSQGCPCLNIYLAGHRLLTC